jgi:Skp family chaperone for outer membrane proteins
MTMFDRAARAGAVLASIFLISVATMSRSADAAGLSDTLKQVDTGPFKDAACRAGIEAMVGTVEGLGTAVFSDLKVEDDAITGKLKLPIGGDWTIGLFATDCSKNAFAFLKPGSDLKISDLAKSVAGLTEVDKLGLSSQAFILSNTEGELAAESAPALVKSALTAAAAGDGGITVAVKPGLTVMGVMDLSKSALTKNALSFLGVKNASDQKLAINGFLGKEMMEAIVKGQKPTPDFTITGTWPKLTMTLPGNHNLPAASLAFSTTVNADGKAFAFNVAVADPWNSALGISGLTLSNVTMDIEAADDIKAALTATTKLGSQSLDVTWEVEKADKAEVAVSLKGTDGKTFNIATLAGLSKVPGIKDLGFKELTVSPTGFGGRVMFKNEELDAAVVFMGTGKKPIVMFKTQKFALKDVDSAVKNTPLGNVEFPSMIFTLAEHDPGSLSAADFPSVADIIIGDLEEKSGGTLHLKQGVGILAVLDTEHLGAAKKALGISGELVVGGNLGGVIGGGEPEIAIFAKLPAFSKMPKFMRAAKDIAPELVLEFKKAGTNIVSDVGVGLVTHLKIGKDELELQTAVRTVTSETGVGLNFAGGLDKWEHAFELRGFTMEDVAVSVGVDVDGSVSAGFQGDVSLKNGSTKFRLEALVTPDPEAAGLPKEVIFDLEANHFSLEGLMDLADVFIGSTGNSKVAKAAKGKGLYKTLQLDKMPLIEFVEYKTDSGAKENVRLFFATPGASDPALKVDGMGIGLEGRMKIAGHEIAQAKFNLAETGIDLEGEVLINKLGPLQIKDAKMAMGASLTELPYMHMNADVKILGLEQKAKIDFSKDEMGFTIEDDFGQAFTSVISATAAMNPAKPDFDVLLEFKGDLLDAVLGGIEKELNKFIAQYKGDVEAAEKDLEKAKKKVQDEEKKVDNAIKKAEADAKKATDKIEAAIKKVNGIQSEINKKEDSVHDKSHDLHKLHWYQVGKAIKLAAEIAGLEIEIGGLYTAKATATAALEVAKAATELTPILFQAGVLAANAAFEVAKGAITASEVAVEASEYIFKGLEKLIEAYRKNFHFTEAKFDGSLQALLGNKPIVVLAKFTAFGQDVNADVNFTPASPEDLGKGIGSMIAKLAKEAVDGIEHAFFGGGSHSNKHSQAVADWAAKNHVTKDSGGFAGAGWGSSGPGGMTIPVKGNLYKNAANTHCLIFKKSKKDPEFAFGDCDSTNDDHLFRFSPKGDLVAVASGEKSSYCLTAKGVERGSDLFLAACNGKPQQKWTLDGSQLKMASGECAAYDGKKKSLILHDCAATDKSQQWETTPIADLEKLSETPAAQLYTVSLRDVGTGTCVDVADKIGLSYECDGSDYQTFNLNSDSQLRVLQDCVRANGSGKGAGVYLGDCDGKETLWTWTGLHLQAKGTKLCIARGKKMGPPINITPLQLEDCSSKTAEWELEPANVDAEGRILPAYHMIRSAAYKRCMEIRTSLQVDGIPTPETVLWECNGDFNQSFSFRWNGEIRSLGKCLAQDGEGVALHDCYQRPNAFQITPAMFTNGGNNNRHSVNNQRWKVRKDGLIQKIGADLCLSVNPGGQRKLTTVQIAAGKFLPAVATKGPVGGIGSLMALQKCNKGSNLQKWQIENTMPDGSKAEPYKRLAHKIDGKERCLETSGDTNIRRLVARDCSDSQYQQFALTSYGEVRQMGRCVTADKTKSAFYSGVQLNLQECRDDASQKFTEGADGLLARPPAGGTQRCVVEGPVFTPGADLFSHLPKEIQAHMKELPSFAPVASGPCLFMFQNKSTKKCMHERSDGVLASGTCNAADPEKANQVMGVVGGKLTFVSLSNNTLRAPHVWIDEPMGSILPTTVPVLPGIDPKMVVTVKQAYDTSGFVYDAKNDQFKVTKSGKPTSDCLATAKAGKAPSEKTLQDLRAKYIHEAVQWTQLEMLSLINHSIRSKANAAKATVDAALKTYEKSAAIGALTTAHCSSSQTQKWEAAPVPRTTWMTK